MNKRKSKPRETMPMRGFTLLETLVALIVMSVMMTAVLTQIGQIQQRARAEQVKLDIFQQSREFMDQFQRDLRQAGYPTLRMFDTTAWSPALASPSSGDSRIAVGITKIAADEIVFEGDADGDGQVDVLDFKRVTTGDNCPCLQRSQVLKSGGGTTFSTEVQNVQSAGTSADPLFVGYTGLGTAVTSADMTTTAGQQALASVKTVQFTMKVKSDIKDLKTNVAPETSLAGQVLLRNCSLAAAHQYNSCS
jgi:prepilin-type N-terminal cleavage/methylation domain-containing protein